MGLLGYLNKFCNKIGHKFKWTFPIIFKNYLFPSYVTNPYFLSLSSVAITLKISVAGIAISTLSFSINGYKKFKSSITLF